MQHNATKAGLLPNSANPVTAKKCKVTANTHGPVTAKTVMLLPTGTINATQRSHNTAWLQPALHRPDVFRITKHFLV